MGIVAPGCKQMTHPIPFLSEVMGIGGIGVGISNSGAIGVGHGSEVAVRIVFVPDPDPIRDGCGGWTDDFTDEILRIVS
ncbi:hypothetical protein ES703_39762 [subsurface metagenome]